MISMTTKHLIATFSTTTNHIVFIMEDFAGADSGTANDPMKDVFVASRSGSTIAEGPAQAIMQIVGHLAAHGEDCLESVRVTGIPTLSSAR